MNSTFTNQSINMTALPNMDWVHFQPLHPKYKRVVLMSAIILGLLLIVLGASGFYLPLEEEYALLAQYRVGVLVGSIVLALSILVLNMLGVSKKGYAIREHDIIYKSGLINRKEITIPFNRVQHIEIYEGAIFRLFGLARIEFFTAGGNLGDLKIPGLLPTEADQIKAFVMKQVLPKEKEQESINIVE